MLAGAGRLEARGRHGGEPEHRGGLGPGVELLFRLAAHHVAVVEGLDAPGDLGVDEGLARGLGEQLGAGAVVLAELRHADSDDGHATHGSSSSAKMTSRAMIPSPVLTRKRHWSEPLNPKFADMTPGGAKGEGALPTEHAASRGGGRRAIEPRHRWRSASRAPRRHGSAGSAPRPWPRPTAPRRISDS